MCGIAGIINPEGFAHTQIREMTDVVRHRGPDDEGFVVWRSLDESPLILGGKDTSIEPFEPDLGYLPKLNVNEVKEQTSILALGHRRLSIIDLSSSGHQPMSYNNGRYWIVLNGEIYNYIELRKELEEQSYKFVSNTDTEVVLAAWQEWGPDCQNRFSGMWAFAIYDSQNQEIILSRDRFGIKPLYYWFSPKGTFYFGSEIKQFTVCDGWAAKLNKDRAYDYLIYSLTDHTEETMFQGVYHIPAGHFYKSIINNLKPDMNEKIICEKWYKPPKNKFKGSFEDAKTVFKELFTEAVARHLRADVHIGSALSGGLDSTAIVSYVNILLRQQGKEELQKTFSSCSADKRYDERIWMDEVVKYTRVDGNFIYPSGKEIFIHSERIIWHQDEPYQSQSAFLGFHVFEKAKEKNVTVLLNGQGADEYLSGYNSFKQMRLENMLRKLKFKAVKNEINAKNSLYKYFKTLRLFFVMLIPEYFKKKFSGRSSNIRELKKIVKIPKYKNGSIVNNRYNEVDPYLVSQYQLLHNPLPKYLRWEDRNSMAHSIEARVPFLDHYLVEFTNSLPLDYLDAKDETKRILINALQDILPEKIRKRKDKKGFLTPEQRWFQDDYKEEFIKMFKEYAKYSQGILDYEKALDYLLKIQKGDLKFSYNYWRLISFCIWMKVFRVKA